MRQLGRSRLSDIRDEVDGKNVDMGTPVPAPSDDPTEVLRSHLRMGRFSGTDGLDDYEADLTAFADSQTAPPPESSSREESGGQGDAKEAAQEPVREESRREEDGSPTERGRPRDGEAASAEVIHSRGRTLIVAGGEVALRQVADRLTQDLDCLLLLTGTEEKSPQRRELGPHSCLCCPSVRVRGSFGCFRAEIPYSEGWLDVGELVDREGKPFDLVLDLTPEGVFIGSWPPLGYYHPEADALEDALAELPRLKGRFEKQHFLALSPETCAHGFAGIRGCTGCIDACPYGALRSGKEAPIVDHLACQGCLACAAACPTGAIEPLLPSRSELLSRLEEAIAAVSHGDCPPVALLHHEASEPGSLKNRMQRNAPVASVSVEALGVLDAEFLLASLNLGAAGVVVFTEDDGREPIAASLNEQLLRARAILRALGRSPERVQGVGAAPMWEIPPRSLSAAQKGARAFAAQDKRAMLSRAVRGLAGGEIRKEGAAPELPEGAPFGGVDADGDGCTLCMACAGACATGAIEPGGDEDPGLRFTESRCVQCGLCVRVCPERALSLAPRLDSERLASAEPVWLHRDRPQLCRVCGRPFASAKMIQRIRSRLPDGQGTGEAGGPEWLEMCGECRVRTLFKDPEDNA